MGVKGMGAKAQEIQFSDLSFALFAPVAVKQGLAEC